MKYFIIKETNWCVRIRKYKKRKYTWLLEEVYHLTNPTNIVVLKDRMSWIFKEEIKNKKIKNIEPSTWLHASVETVYTFKTDDEALLFLECME